MSKQEIFTSTGSLGLDYRHFDRLYLNWRNGAIDDVAFLEPWARRAKYAIENEQIIHENVISRCVGRFLISARAFRQLSSYPILSEGLEAAVPTENGWNPVIMTMFGYNHPDRTSHTPLPLIIEQTNSVGLSRLSPIERIRDIRSLGYQFAHQIESHMIPQILTLWGTTFGWEMPEIHALQMRLRHESFVEPRMRSVWFSAITYQNEIVALATAERLSLPSQRGKSVEVIESTEWRCHPGWEGRGLTASAVIHLHAQVARDMRNIPHMVIAETNFYSQAFYVGAAAGMEIPPRNLFGVSIPQVLIQNVPVGDGLELVGKRDFIMMYVPHHISQHTYSQRNIEAILEGGTV